MLKSYSDVLKLENKNSLKKDFSNLTYEIQGLFNWDLRDIILKLIV
jgi:hypothetical protein